MHSQVPQWLAALPEESASPRTEFDPLAVFGELASKPVPTGRWRRAWELGSLQATLVAGWLAFQMRRHLAPADEHERMRHEMHLRAALQCFRSMGYLRGAVTKAGQLLSNTPGATPEAVADVLAHLHSEAPPMHFALIREVLEGELGCRVDQAFVEFEVEPFAAASLGQVHRARLPGGEPVAVKVQYPGVAQAIRDDFANLSTLLSAMRLMKSGRHLREQAAELRRLVELESDYEIEARFQSQARERLADVEGVVVPRVYESCSTKRVLTTDWLEAQRLDEYLAARPSQDDRNRRCERMYAALFRLFYAGRVCYTDVSPGNFLFLRDGRVGLIDFGSMRVFDEDDWAYLSEMERVDYADRDELRRLVQVSAGAREGERLDPEYVEHVADMFEWLWAPLREERPFDFGDREIFERGVRRHLESVDPKFARSLPINAWLIRSFLGARTIAWRLRAVADIATLHRREAKRVGFYGGSAS